MVLSAYAVPWPEARGLTLSFAPDGTMAAGQPSALFSTLNARLSPAQWQTEVLRAFQTWAVETNVNIGLVADGGQPFGTLGLKQGDPRFGDIRIGAYPMAADVLAVADPYDPFVANTWVGDVFLNSAYTFDSGTPAGNYDLFSVLLHEAGHVFGIGHSNDPNSPMFERLRGASTKLTAADVTAIRNLYGTRTADDFEGPPGNDTLDTATPLDTSPAGNGDEPLTVEADISSPADADYFRFEAPAATASLDVAVQAAGISLLTPRLDVIDAAGHRLASAMSADPLHNDVRLALAGIQPGETYFVRVAAARSDVFGIGSYHLTIEPRTSETVAAEADGSSEAAPSSPQVLATTPGYVEHTYYEIDGTLSSAVAARTYQVRSTDLGPGMTNVMTVVIDGEGDGSTRYSVSVVDDHGHPVAANIVAYGPGKFAAQVPAVQSNRDYFVTVGSAQPLDEEREFEIEVDFAQDASHLQTFVNDSLAADQQFSARTLEVTRSQEFHFDLAASDWSVPSETGVRMTIRNAENRDVFSTAVADGTTRASDVFLDQGRYTVVFTRAAAGSRTPLLFQLSGLTLSDALGPQLRDTTQAPFDATTEVVQSQLSFYWQPYNPPAIAASDKSFAPPLSALARAQLTPSGSLVSASKSDGPTERRLQTPDVPSDVSLRDAQTNATRYARANSPPADPWARIVDAARAVKAARKTGDAQAVMPARLTDATSTSEEYADGPLANRREIAIIQGAEGAVVSSTASSALSPSSEAGPLAETASLAETSNLADVFFAWMAERRASDYAVWTVGAIGMSLGWYVWKMGIASMPAAAGDGAEVSRRTPGRRGSRQRRQSSRWFVHRGDSLLCR